MSQSNRCRRLSVAPLAGVGRRGRGSLSSGSLAVGISNSLLSGSRFIQGTHPFSGVLSQFDQGQSSGGRGPVFTGQGSNRACSSSLSGLLQPVVCSDESLRSVEAGHRSLSLESKGTADILQDGDSPIRASVSTPGGLDGVSGLEGCILAGSDASGISQVPQVHGGREGVPVQGSLLWTLHRSAGFHQGHGSCVRYSSQDWGAASPLPGRLVNSGLLSGAGSPCSEDSAPALQFVRNSHQLVIPTQRMVYLGVILDSISFRASPALKRVKKLLSIGDVFLSCAKQPVSSWLELLGVLSSMIQLVPGGRLRKRSLQLVLRRHWDHVDQSILVEWSQEILQDLDWWLDRARLERGISLEQVSPQLELWSDASDVGWGAHLDEVVTSGLWAPEEVESSINVRELLAIERALRWFAPQLVGSLVAIFADNSTAIAYLRNQGGTHSPLLNSIAQRILRWAESLPVVNSPQFIMGKHNVLVDALSRPNQIQGSEWTLKQEVFQDLCKRWPVSIDLFATSLNHRCSIYFSPYHDRNALGMDALLQSWNGWQAYAFPPWSLIPAVLKNLRSSSGVLLTIIAPYWPQRPWFLDLLDLVVDGPVTLPQSRDLLRQPHFHRFHLGVSRLSLHAWRLSSDLPAPGDSPSV